MRLPSNLFKRRGRAYKKKFAKMNELTQIHDTNMEKEDTKLNSIRQEFTFNMQQMKKEIEDIYNPINEVKE